ncbi:hypothetical protein [Sneathiella sp.]|uniref:hypothetical protein n=1 Tax=Sneathiella sp. TaxID=1964365 RepID=UPI00356A2FE5
MIESGTLVETLANEEDATNIRKSIWNKRRPVLHMALAAGNEIANAHTHRQIPSKRLTELQDEWQVITPDCERAIANGDEQSAAISEWNRLSKAISEERKSSEKPIELEEIVFDPVWVEPALKQAEEWAGTMQRHQIVPKSQIWRFTR